MSPAHKSTAYTPLGHRLEELRRALGIVSQSQFAKRLNISPQRFSAWLVGKAEPNVEMLAAIRRETGVDLNYLIAGDIAVQPGSAAHPIRKYRVPA